MTSSFHLSFSISHLLFIMDKLPKILDKSSFSGVARNCSMLNVNSMKIDNCKLIITSGGSV